MEDEVYAGAVVEAGERKEEEEGEAGSGEVEHKERGRRCWGREEGRRGFFGSRLIGILA